jgi:serine/threonine protein kinase/Tol biopolymer transport system component
MNTGDYLGRYRIVRKIGEGGMGEVFLAEDPKLARQIAVKVLSADFASDADRMARFVYEAISASSLNHPNIITIYEINDEHEPPFIAMEYVEGETLGRRMKRSPLEVHETLDVAIQVATALAAAHEANVVHRDVKPDNVILRPDGLVKVLDFGLAKQVAPRSITSFEEVYAGVPEVKTHPGLVMGTVAYMSPEQARGKLVDARSDIFSFGAMLYQMASGRLPFIGENDIDVVGSILHKDPRPLSQAARTVPHDVELLIKKALRKNRDERYQSMRELVADLREIREELRVDSKNGLKSNGNGHSNGHASSELSEAERGMPTEQMHAAGIMSTRELSMPPSTLSGILFSEIRQHPVRSLSYSALFAVLLTGLFYGVYMVAESWRRPEAFQTMRLAKLTYSGNVESFNAAISPDGKYLAYVTKDAGEEGLLIKQTATDSGITIVSQGPNDITGVAFSPDSNFVYYSMSERGGQSALYQAPAMGGPPRKLIADAEKNATFSPDGKTLAVIRNSTQILLADAADGGNIRELRKAEEGNRYINLSWSPKGDVIAAVYFSQNDSNDHLVKISATDGAESKISSTVPWLRLRGVSWLPDASAIVVSGRDRDIQASQLWEIGYPGGVTRRITNDLTNYQGATLTRDGKSILSIQENYRSNLWTGMGGAPAKQISSEMGRDEGMSGVAIAPNGKAAYTVRIKGDQDIWTVNADGTDNRQVTFNVKANFAPAFSPDGRYIVFLSTRGGNIDIWRMDADGSNPLQLTNSVEQESDPYLSPDGKFVYFASLGGDQTQFIKRVPVEGGTAERLTEFGSRRPVVAPDGKAFVCEARESLNDPSPKLTIVSMSDGSVVTLNAPTAVRSRTIRWTADGKGLIFIDSKNRVDNLWIQPIDGSPARQLTNFESDRIFRFDVTRDGSAFAMARGSEDSDVVMVSDFR